MKYSCLLLVLLPLTLTAQSTIGVHSIPNASVILDFPEGTTRGIILPAVQELPAVPEHGTFLYDWQTSTVKMFENNTWVALSKNGDSSNLVPYTGTVSTERQTIIGSYTTKVYNGNHFEEGPVSGALVLEGATKALVLPKIAHTAETVKSPYPGMMCYDTTRKALAVFDGVQWYYWK
ncbi:hypothetical protein ACKUSY_15595 [Myroides odoratus]